MLSSLKVSEMPSDATLLLTPISRVIVSRYQHAGHSILPKDDRDWANEAVPD